MKYLQGKRVLTGYYALRFEILERDSFTCQYCGHSAPEVVLHVDHIRAKTNGGNDDKDNLITACTACNVGKGTLTLLRMSGQSVERTRRAPSQMLVLNAMQRMAGSDLPVIAQNLNMKLTRIRVIVHRLKAKGLIVKDQGKWKLATVKRV